MSTGNPKGTHLYCYEPIKGIYLYLEKKFLFTSYAEFRFSSYFPKKVARMRKEYANIQFKWESVKIGYQKSDQEKKKGISYQKYITRLESL